MPLAHHFKELRVFQTGFEAAMKIFEASNAWPREERYSLTDQIRRSSRPVCGNIAEAWRKRLYVANFVSKLSDADAEAAETQVWLKFAHACGYLDETACTDLNHQYEQLHGGLVRMMVDPNPWCGPALIREDPAGYDIASAITTNPGDDLVD